MLLFGHLGITLGSFEAGASVYRWLTKKPLNLIPYYPTILIGSVLPDIIDKPLGGIILKDTIGNGRIYAHTLLFLLSLFVIGGYFWFRFHSNTGIITALGCLGHDILDELWLQPDTFLWPAFGWSFPKENSQQWLHMWLAELMSDPGVYIPELIGFTIFLVLIYRYQKVK